MVDIGSIKYKGTVYGPEEFMPEHMKRFRAMNLQEQNDYFKKVRKTGGFDVDGCTGVMPGRIVPLPPDCRDWELAEFAAEFAAEKQAEEGGKKIKFVRLIKANTAPVEGILYYLTLAAIDATDQLEKTYKAKVWFQPASHLKLVYFEDPLGGKKRFRGRPKLRSDFKRSREKAIRYDTEETITAKLRGEVPSLGLNSNTVHKGFRTTAPKPGQLLRDGFSILVEELKRQNPLWKHAKARRAASKKWKSFCDAEKLPFTQEAHQRFYKKHG